MLHLNRLPYKRLLNIVHPRGKMKLRVVRYKFHSAAVIACCLSSQTVPIIGSTYFALLINKNLSYYISLHNF